MVEKIKVKRQTHSAITEKEYVCLTELHSASNCYARDENQFTEEGMPPSPEPPTPPSSETESEVELRNKLNRGEATPSEWAASLVGMDKYGHKKRRVNRRPRERSHTPSDTDTEAKE